MNATAGVRSRWRGSSRGWFHRMMGVVSMVALSSEASAQNFRITSFSIDGGSSVSGGERFRVEGTVGHPASGPSLIGLNYQVDGGVWAEPEDNGAVEAPVLSIQWVDSKRVRIFWGESRQTWQLEHNNVLGSPGWTPVPGAIQAPVLFQSSESAAMFRLRLKP